MSDILPASRLRRFALPLGLALLLAAPMAAQAQFSDSYKFLKAARERDGTTVTELLNDPASRIINTRDDATGETALAMAVRRRDTVWTRFLLQKGADPAIGDKQGVTPLMHAALLDFADGAEALIGSKAEVNQTNRRGETALILAVQQKNAALVRLLMRNGANPDLSDHIAGMSARDYAKRNDRSGQMLELLNAGQAATKAPVFGPK